jgi:hypothetical protein
MSNNHDKRELLKLKQGLIEDSDVIKKEETVKVELHGRKKLENFWYHNKVAVFIILFFIGVAVYFVFDMMTKNRADISFMYVGTSQEASYFLSTYNSDLSHAFSLYTPNFDGNGYVFTQIIPIDTYNQYNPTVIMANQTKIFAEMQAGMVRLIIGNRDAFEHLVGRGEDAPALNDVFVDLSRLYPRNENITDNVLFKLQGSGLMEAAGVGDYFWEYTDDLYIGLLSASMRRPEAQLAHERSLEVLDNIIRNNKVTDVEMIRN